MRVRYNRFFVYIGFLTHASPENVEKEKIMIDARVVFWTFVIKSRYALLKKW